MSNMFTLGLLNAEQPLSSLTGFSCSHNSSPVTPYRLTRKLVDGLTARARAMKGPAITYPRIGRYDQIWTGLCRFFLFFLALQAPFLTGFPNLLNFLDRSRARLRHMPC